MDDADAAQEFGRAQLEAACAVPRVARRPADEFCRVCGDEIPFLRRLQQPGVRTCEHCQGEIEAQ